MTFPSTLLFPSTTLFPSAIPVGIDGIGVILSDLNLTTIDPSGVQRRTFSPLVGWDGSPASSATTTVTQKPRGPGAWLSPRNFTQRSVTLNGSLEAPDPTTLQTAIEELVASVTLSDTVLTLQRGNTTRSLICCRDDEVLLTDVTDTLVNWSIQLVAADPRKFATAQTGSCALPFTSGGTPVPTPVPTPLVSTDSPGTIQLTSPGNATGAVVVRVDGPVSGPIITHAGSGLQLAFASSLVLMAGEWLEIDMEAQTALANGQSSRNAYIEYSTTGFGWSGFEPGANLWRVDSASYNPDTLFTVTATPAWQ